MRWDVYAFRAPTGTRRLDDIPQGYRPPSVGSTADVIDVVRQVRPDVDATDSTWLVLQGEDHSIEVALGKGVQVHDVTFYVRGGHGAVAVILDVCRRLGVTPYETESGEVLHGDSQPGAPRTAESDGGEAKRHWWHRWTRAGG